MIDIAVVEPSSAPQWRAASDWSWGTAGQWAADCPPFLRRLEQPREKEEGKNTSSMTLIRAMMAQVEIGGDMEAVRLSGDWVTPEQAAEYLGVSKQTVRAWCKAGKLKSVKLGHHTVRIAVSSIERMMERVKQ